MPIKIKKLPQRSGKFERPGKFRRSKKGSLVNSRLGSSINSRLGPTVNSRLGPTVNTRLGPPVGTSTKSSQKNTREKVREIVSYQEV
jgi:hypothetical protein